MMNDRAMATFSTLRTPCLIGTNLKGRFMSRSIKQHIESFVAEAEQFIELSSQSIYSFVGVLSWDLQTGECSRTEEEWAALETHEGEVKDAVARMVDVGRGLAEILEQADEDSTSLLKFLHTANDPQGNASDGWLDLKIELERIAIKRDSCAPDDRGRGETSSRLHPTAQRCADYITKNPGCSGADVASDCSTSEENVRRIVSNSLKPLGFYNDRKTGYFAPESM
jgi:hypothetical protein